VKNIKTTQHGSVYPFLDARTPMANSNLLPIKLSVYLNGAQFRIGLQPYATKEIFDKAVSGNGNIPVEAKIIKEQVDGYLQKAKDILYNFPKADQKQFANLFKSEANLKVQNKTNLEVLFQMKIDELKEEDRAGSACFYEQSMLAFKRFRKDFFLEDITVQYLKTFRSWYTSEGNSNATAQIYLRSLRHIYNRAIKDGYISVGHYPFKEFKIGTASRSKDVLYPEQLKALWEYEPKTNGEKKAKDFFFFLYLCNGMNIKDALALKGKNIRGNMISFIRAKTSRTSNESKEIIVYLHPEAKKIIERWGTLNTKDYLFPHFRGLATDVERKHAKDVMARNINRDLRAIGEQLGFEVNLTLNLARHSYATRLKIDGVATSFISDALGHSNGSTTEHYLKTLPDQKFKTISEGLLKF
jgi:integrase/recombinase XerD